MGIYSVIHRNSRLPNTSDSVPSYWTIANDRLDAEPPPPPPTPYAHPPFTSIQLPPPPSNLLVTGSELWQDVIAWSLPPKAAVHRHHETDLPAEKDRLALT